MVGVLVNPSAGAGSAAGVAQAVTQALSARGLAFEVVHTEYPGHAEELARTMAGRELETLLIVGGDGTVFEAARGLLGTNVALGIIPAGTGNDFAKTLNLPRKPLDALAYALEHAPRQVDAGRVNGRLFGNECGTGFDVTVLENARRFKRLAKGLLPYLLGVLCAIVRYKPVSLRFTLEDGTCFDRAITVCAVANGGFIGGGIPIAPKADAFDGLLDVVILPQMPRWKMPRLLPGLLTGKILSFPGVESFRCQRICFHGKDMHVNVDGEIIHMDEAALEIVPKALWMRV